MTVQILNENALIQKMKQRNKLISNKMDTRNLVLAELQDSNEKQVG
jgi:hypothetical protein